MNVAGGKVLFDQLFYFVALIVGDFCVDSNLVMKPVSGLCFILIEAGIILPEVKNHDNRCSG